MNTKKGNTMKTQTQLETFRFRLWGNKDGTQTLTATCKSIDEAVLFYSRLLANPEWGLLAPDDIAIIAPDYIDTDTGFYGRWTLGEVLDAIDEMELEQCRDCGNPTHCYSHRFVNRIPSWDDFNRFRYICSECADRADDQEQSEYNTDWSSIIMVGGDK